MSKTFIQIQNFSSFTFNCHDDGRYVTIATRVSSKQLITVIMNKCIGTQLSTTYQRRQCSVQVGVTPLTHNLRTAVH
jgi:hypothetical protein